MSATLTNILETCQHLLDEGPVNLSLLYSLKSDIISLPPSSCLRSQCHAKVRVKIEKKFPQLPDWEKLEGSNDYFQDLQTIYDELLPFHTVLFTISNYLSKIRDTLNDLIKKIPHFTLFKNFNISMLYIKLFNLYVRIIYLLSFIPEKTTIISLYCSTSYLLFSNNENMLDNYKDKDNVNTTSYDCINSYQFLIKLSDNIYLEFFSFFQFHLILLIHLYEDLFYLFLFYYNNDIIYNNLFNNIYYDENNIGNFSKFLLIIKEKKDELSNLNFNDTSTTTSSTAPILGSGVRDGDMAGAKGAAATASAINLLEQEGEGEGVITFSLYPALLEINTLIDFFYLSLIANPFVFYFYQERDIKSSLISSTNSPVDSPSRLEIILSILLSNHLMVGIYRDLVVSPLSEFEKISSLFPSDLDKAFLSNVLQSNNINKKKIKKILDVKLKSYFKNLISSAGLISSAATSISLSNSSILASSNDEENKKFSSFSAFSSSPKAPYFIMSPLSFSFASSYSSSFFSSSSSSSNSPASLLPLARINQAIRRDYFVKELESIHNLSLSLPSLVAPKLPLILALLSCLKYETLNYFLHHSDIIILPKKFGGKDENDGEGSVIQTSMQSTAISSNNSLSPLPSILNSFGVLSLYKEFLSYDPYFHQLETLFFLHNHCHPNYQPPRFLNDSEFHIYLQSREKQHSNYFFIQDYYKNFFTNYFIKKNKKKSKFLVISSTFFPIFSTFKDLLNNLDKYFELIESDGDYEREKERQLVKEYYEQHGQTSHSNSNSNSNSNSTKNEIITDRKLTESYYQAHFKSRNISSKAQSALLNTASFLILKLEAYSTQISLSSSQRLLLDKFLFEMNEMKELLKYLDNSTYSDLIKNSTSFYEVGWFRDILYNIFVYSLRGLPFYSQTNATIASTVSSSGKIGGVASGADSENVSGYSQLASRHSLSIFQPFIDIFNNLNSLTNYNLSLSLFPNSSNPFFQKELKLLGSSSLKFANSLLGVFDEFVNSHLKFLWDKFSQFEAQYQPQEALKRLEKIKLHPRSAQSAFSLSQTSPDHVEAYAGCESEVWAAPQIMNFIQVQQRLELVIQAAKDLGNTSIYYRKICFPIRVRNLVIKFFRKKILETESREKDSAIIKNETVSSLFFIKKDMLQRFSVINSRILIGVRVLNLILEQLGLGSKMTLRGIFYHELFDDEITEDFSEEITVSNNDKEETENNIEEEDDEYNNDNNEKDNDQDENNLLFDPNSDSPYNFLSISSYTFSNSLYKYYHERQNSLIYKISNWFVKIIDEIIKKKNQKYIWNPHLNTFQNLTLYDKAGKIASSSSFSSFPIDLYLNPHEFSSLINIVGSRGLDYIIHHLDIALAKEISFVVSYIEHSLNNLRILSKIIFVSLQKSTNLDYLPQLFASLEKIGIILVLRGMLQEALANQVEEFASDLISSLELYAFKCQSEWSDKLSNSTPTSILSPHLSLMHLLSKSLGLTGSRNISLILSLYELKNSTHSYTANSSRTTPSKSNNFPPTFLPSSLSLTHRQIELLYSYLPVLGGALMGSLEVWSESNYLPSMGVFDTNQQTALFGLAELHKISFLLFIDYISSATSVSSVINVPQHPSPNANSPTPSKPRKPGQQISLQTLQTILHNTDHTAISYLTLSQFVSEPLTESLIQDMYLNYIEKFLQFGSQFLLNFKRVELGYSYSSSTIPFDGMGYLMVLFAERFASSGPIGQISSASTASSSSTSSIKYLSMSLLSRLEKYLPIQLVHAQTNIATRLTTKLKNYQMDQDQDQDQDLQDPSQNHLQEE